MLLCMEVLLGCFMCNLPEGHEPAWHEVRTGDPEHPYIAMWKPGFSFYPKPSWSTLGINRRNSFAAASPLVRPVVHHLSYQDMPADIYHPRGWTRVRCSGCPRWGIELEPPHSEDDYRRLELMHVGIPAPRRGD